MADAQVGVTVAETPKAVAQAAFDYVAPLLDTATLAKPMHLVLAGGSTPEVLYELLAKAQDLPWQHIHIWFGDERTVSPDHDDSNFKMAARTLLSHIELPEANIHRMQGELNPDEAATAYAAEISSSVPINSDGIPVFDVILLGMGDDGHTASLFPGTAALEERSAHVVANNVPQHNTTRLTLTYPILNSASQVIFLVTGEAKADAVAAVIKQAHDSPPAGSVSPTSGKTHWFLDRAAASQLT